ncbi:hypothetical protein HYU95_00900 [Candidatus Daviesbacteria bacterium]|nr:hypothetical protein [Candidatus Daviesbacteria bacterium]
MNRITFRHGVKALIFLFLFVVILPKDLEAKVLPQAQKGIQKSGTATKAVKTAGIVVSPKLRSDRRALIINFSNLQNATAVSYLLTYKTSTQDEGAMGSLNLDGSATARNELLFGTCSKNVCRYHTGIKDAKLDISYTLKNGKKYLKKYKIKV